MRQLRFERLDPRRVFAVAELDFVDFDVSQIGVSEYRFGTPVSAYRAVSVAQTDMIRTVGLHPRGEILEQRDSQPIALPSGATFGELTYALDADTGFGLVHFPDDSARNALWITPDRPVLIDGEVLTGYATDFGAVLAINRGSFSEVVKYSELGDVVAFTTLQGEYFDAASHADVVVLFGNIDGAPAVATVDANLSVAEQSLALPENSFVAVASDFLTTPDNIEFVGFAIDADSNVLTVIWDESGAVSRVISGGGAPYESSGTSLLIEHDETLQLLVHDAALAQLLGIEADTPVSADTVPLIQQSGLQAATFTTIFEQDGELIVGVTGLTTEQEVSSALLVTAKTFFSSPWQNRRDRFDVNDDGHDSPLDVLIGINEVNRSGSRRLSAEDLVIAYYWDVDGDGFLVPLDILLGINLLNARAAGGEGSDGEQEALHSAAFSFIAAADEFDWKRRDRHRFFCSIAA